MGAFKKDISSSVKRRSTTSYTIVCKRVSRSANYTFGLFPDQTKNKFTDCILEIKHEVWSPIKLLFNIRVLLSNDDAESRFLRGSGAKYLSVEELKKIELFDFSSLHPSEFEQYKHHYFSLNCEQCFYLEEKIRRKGSFKILPSLEGQEKRVLEAVS
ncbi:hypothetical protein [Agaribacterium sp. ZY112]|uniref:hypothetical protein n=1 Tax=Agaribacterium sp. ZY112 TaxID=3233574 RepID=UPI0035259113